MATFVTYRSAAELAASVERAGNYQYAAALWADAESYTANTENLHWCIRRAANCRRLHALRKEKRHANK